MKRVLTLWLLPTQNSDELLRLVQQNQRLKYASIPAGPAEPQQLPPVPAGPGMKNAKVPASGSGHSDTFYFLMVSSWEVQFKFAAGVETKLRARHV